MIITSLNLYSHFGFMLWSCAFISCICLFCQNIKIYMDISWVICFSCKSIYKDSIVFWGYVCILNVLSKHTYAMKYNFDDFHILKFVMIFVFSKFMLFLRNIELHCHFHDVMFHITLVHSPLLKKLYGLYGLECLSALWFMHISWKTFDLFLDWRIPY